MSDGPYTEGWPRKASELHGFGDVRVVLFSDAERMREALYEIKKQVYETPGLETWRHIQAIANAAVLPEQGK